MIYYRGSQLGHQQIMALTVPHWSTTARSTSSRPAAPPLATKSSLASGPTARDKTKPDNDKYQTHTDSSINILNKTD